jgi:hypothetical protein
MKLTKPILCAISLLGLLLMPQVSSAFAGTPPSTNANTAASWDISVMDSAGDVGYFTSIFVDKNDKVHISYIDGTRGYLRYATNISGQWETSDVVPASKQNTSIVVDSTGKVYIGYSGRVLSKDDSGQWTSQNPGVFYSVRSGPSLAVDKNNVIHLLAITAHTFPLNPLTYYDAEYTNNTNGSFGNHVYPPTCMTGAITLGSPSLAVDSNGKAHAAFTNSGYLVYSTNKTGSWGCGGYVTSNTGPYSYSNRYIVADSTGNARFPQTDGSGSTSLGLDAQDKSHVSDFYNNCLRYTTNVSGSSDWAYVDCSSEKVGEYNSIAVDSQGNVHIAYFDRTNGDLKYAVRRNSYKLFLPMLAQP